LPELALQPLVEHAPAPVRLPSPRRIVVWSPNYAPELTGIPPLVTDACEWLAGRGHDVDVVTAFPNYPERRIHDTYRRRLWRSEHVTGVDVHRSWLRVRPEERFRDKVLYELSFAACSAPLASRRLRGADVLVCVVPSLLAAAAAARLVRRHSSTKLVLWVQDLVLQGALALEDVGAVERRMLAAARRLEARAFRAADRVVVCCPGFRDYLMGTGLDEQRISTIYNWVDTEWLAPAPRLPHPGWTRFLYAGNLGYSQDFETLVDAAERAGVEIELDIVGDGNAARYVRELAAATDNVTVYPPVARNEFPALLASADVQVVVQRAVSAGANLPSKIASYLASGRPVVAAIGLDSPAADLLRESGGAVLVEPESPVELAAAMRLLHERADLRADLARRGREFAVRNLGKDATLERLEQELIG
jgi:colanic acid biosynthesis glycosyl transferase WcaI